MKIKLAFIFIVLSFISFGKPLPINVYIIIDETNISKVQIQEMTKSIFQGTDAKFARFDVFQASWETRYPDSWMEDKSTVNFSSLKIDCKYNPCSSLKNFIRDKASEKTKLFYGTGAFDCDLRSFGLESAPIQNDASSILSKINDEYTINKAAGKNLTLIFYIPSRQLIKEPVLTINQDTIKAKKGETFKLQVDVNGTFSKVTWEPSDGLSCNDCLDPLVNIQDPKTYTVKAESEYGCTSNTLKVVVDPQKTCEGKFYSCEIQYDIDENLYRKVLGDGNKWLMASSQPGSKIYYLICSPNCGNSFEVSLYDVSNRKIMSEKFELDEIAKGQKLHLDYKEYFIFKVNLNQYEFESKDFYRFEIKTWDEEEYKYPVFRSPLTKFVDCGFTE